MKPRLAISMGDPVGIGPEIIVKSLAHNDVDALVFGDPGALRAAAELVASPLEVVEVERAGDPLRPGAISVFAVSRLRPEERIPAQPGSGSDRAQLDAIFAAVDAVESGLLDALVTAPISKAAIARAGSVWPGHTELLAELAGRRRNRDPFVPVMMLAGDRLRVVTVTTHVALREVSSVLTEALLVHAIEVVDESLRTSFSIARPRIAVAGLNPHAGEGGLFGDEESRLFAPAIASTRARGIDVVGPIPGDAVFRRALEGAFDVVISGYHDQALIPIKLVDFDRAVNVTLGLPFVRTSVDHGTAYDLAGKGIASATSFDAALELAERMVRAARMTSFARLDALRRGE
ncbi:MAG: 4-hydroxythreonine-4-phosphate dehydrogenase PdxA [Deltaproteobacteria bacterium]|nr:4-hydroxythreonine-4-phosphate dehydrogenase PdxA [Deltaproteobacteria bacterium]